MDYFVISFTLFFALLSVVCSDSVKSSCYFLLTSCGVSVNLYRMGFVEFSLILLFMSSFSLALYLLVGLFFSKRLEVKNVYGQKKYFMMGGLCFFIFLVVLIIFFVSTSNALIVAPREVNILSYLKIDFIQNIPLLFTFGVLLISSLAAVLFFVMPTSQQDRESL